jgi:membrane fusion protein (multidrug efflux system)
MKFKANRALIILAILIWMATGGGCGRTESNAEPEKKPEQPQPVKVSVIIVKPMPMKDILLLPGQTEAWGDVRVGADIGGRVDWIGPREGDQVQKGDLLAKIDVSGLKAALDRARAAYELASDLFQRRQKLSDEKIITQEELERSRTERDLADATLRQARVEYERGFLRSPITGAVDHLFVDQGEFIERGQPVADVVHVDKIKINVNVPEMDVRYLQVGQEALVTIDAFGEERYPGVIDFVAYKADPATKTFLVRVVIDNPRQQIRPGMIARVAFLRQVIPDALTAPLFALVDKGGERVLFIEKDGVVQARTVTIGIIEGDHVQIISGLSAGDHLIVSGQNEVVEGMRVLVQ